MIIASTMSPFSIVFFSSELGGKMSKAFAARKLAKRELICNLKKINFINKNQIKLPVLKITKNNVLVGPLGLNPMLLPGCQWPLMRTQSLDHSNTRQLVGIQV
jgi:hypothetical protein